MSKNYPVTCIVCCKMVRLIDDHDGEDDRCLAPNIEGGDINIVFHYGSKFDMVENLSVGMDVKVQAVICDKCFATRQHLTRKVNTIESRRWEVIPI